MDIKKYTPLMDRQMHTFACEYCGNEFNSYNSQASACPFCGIYSEKSSAEFSEDEAFNSAKALNSAIIQGSEYDLEKSASKILSLKNIPQQIYSLAILYKRSSELEHSTKNYDIPGFMEENSEHEEKAIDLFSKAKGLLYDAIFACNRALATAANAEIYYVKFLAEIELENMHDAKGTLELLAKTSPRKEMLDYASMLYAIKMNQKDTIEHINSVIGNGDITGFYYLAKYLAANGKLEESKHILENLLNKENILVARLLIDKIKKAQP